jgi:hypothetical protein
VPSPREEEGEERSHLACPPYEEQRKHSIKQTPPNNDLVLSMLNFFALDVFVDGESGDASSRPSSEEKRILRLGNPSLGGEVGDDGSHRAAEHA